MWYLILSFLLLLYVLINRILPQYFDAILGTYIIRPLLWVFVAITVFIIANYEGFNIWYYNKTHNHITGEKPIHIAILVAGFQLSLLVMTGLFAGFGKSPYSFTPIAILTNIFFVGSFLTGTELSRAYLIKKGTQKRNKVTITIFLTSILFTLMQIPPTKFSLLSFQSPLNTIEFIGVNLISAFVISLFASYLSYLGGAKTSLAYMGIIMGFEWFMPVLPNTPWIMTAFIGTIAPAIGFIILEGSIQKKRQQRKHYQNQSSWTVIAVVAVVIAFFSFGIFGVTPTVIYSGSMQPLYEVGDIVIIDESEPDNLQVGDIIQFYDPMDNKTKIIHRIVNTTEENNISYYLTKGDANSQPDATPITEKRIIGKPIFTIPKLGWVQILVKSTLNSFNIQI